MPRSFEELVDEASRAPILGWDFGWLRGRAFEERPSWHYFELVAERAGDEVLSLPLSPAHSDEDIADAIGALRRVHERFTG